VADRQRIFEFVARPPDIVAALTVLCSPGHQVELGSRVLIAGQHQTGRPLAHHVAEHHEHGDHKDRRRGELNVDYDAIKFHDPPRSHTFG
jgi:hypothetical protein